MKKNGIFIFLFILAVFCLVKKDAALPMNIVSHPDSYIQFSTEQKILEQTWLSTVKKISEVSFDCRASKDFGGRLQLTVLDGESREILASAVQSIDFIQGEEGHLTFAFSPFSVVAGKQYIFQLQLEATKEAGEILISSGSNYMGCSVAGEDRGQAAAFQITYLKSSRIFWLFSSFFPFAAMSFLFMVFWKRKWEETIGLALTAGIGILFAAGLFNRLEAGIAVLYLISTACFIWGIVLYNKRGLTVKDIFSPGMIIFALILVLLLVNCSNGRLARWDEFSHWGLAAKDMFYSNSFAKHFDSTVMLKYYPPIATLIEYFFCYTNGIYADSMLYAGFQFMGLSLLSAGLGIGKRNKTKYILPVVLLLSLSPIIFFNDVYNSLYVDPALAFGVAYVLICYYTEELSKFNLLRIAGGLFVLTLTKDTGVVLAGLLTLVMLGDTLFKQYKAGKYEIKKLALPLLCTGLVCSFFFIWQIYLSIPIENNVQTAAAGTVQGTKEEPQAEAKAETMAVNGAISASGINLEKILELCKGDAPAYRYTVIKNYIDKLFSENVYSFGIISFSYMDLAVILLVIALLCANMNCFAEKKEKLLSFGIFTFIAGLGYCGFLLVTYLFSFSENEALILTSYVRYLGSYVCGVFIAQGILIMDTQDEGEQKTSLTLIYLVCAFMITAAPFGKFLTKNMDTEVTDDQIYGFDTLAEILRSGAKKNELVYFVCNNSDGYSNLIFKNAVVPMQSSYAVANLFPSKDSYLKQMEIYAAAGEGAKGQPVVLSAQEWAERLKAYEYVVILHPNDVFEAGYGELMEEPSTIDDGVIYRVREADGGVKLQYVGKTGIKQFR